MRFCIIHAYSHVTEIERSSTTRGPGNRRDFKKVRKVDRNEKEMVGMIDGSLLKEDFADVASIDSQSATATFVFPQSLTSLGMVTTTTIIVRRLST